MSAVYVTAAQARLAVLGEPRRDAATCRVPGYAQAALTTPKTPVGDGVRQWLTAQCRRIACEWSCDRRRHREIVVRLEAPLERSVWVEIPADMTPAAARTLYLQALLTVRQRLSRAVRCDSREASAVARAALHELFVQHAGELPARITRRGAALQVERGHYTLRFAAADESPGRERFEFVCWTSHPAALKL